MISGLRHIKTGEELTVELEVGATWWLRNERGEIETASKAHFAAEAWEFRGASGDTDQGDYQ